MCQAKIPLAVAVLWVLFSIYYQKNLGTLQADLGTSCPIPSTLYGNSDTVDSFSCHHEKTGPGVCAANGDWWVVVSWWTRPLQADTARLHQTAQFLFAEGPVWHQMGCVGTSLPLCISTSLQTALIYSYNIACLQEMATAKTCRWYSFLMVQPS